ncbi:MAG: transrane sensor [Acidobacteriota bacterium]|jgi:hypothetical protein|nr:transrane sensor [Acidobacteriota bacterium]
MDETEEETEEEITMLLRIAGRRPQLPEDEVAPARAAAREVFRQQARRAARRRCLGWTAAAGLAASLLLFIALTSRGPVARKPVATLEMRTGAVAVSRAAGPRDLLAGAVLTTEQGGAAAMRLPSGASVRIDGGSSVRIDSARRVTLERGALYVDSGPAAALDDGIEVSTALGSIRDIGTQFEVRLLQRSTLRVRVREGRVLVDRAGEVHQARAGGELVLAQDGSFRRAGIQVHGPAWDWVQRAAPPFEIEGASLADFLGWVSRETGLPWRLAGPREYRRERLPEEVILHGSIEGLTAEDALSVVLPASGYRHRRVGGQLLIERAGG